ncbi:MAG: hypothetical protein IJT91_07725 [Clostridia bacterium]|nr:hypothetical protein [Clostridia bacterium]
MSLLDKLSDRECWERFAEYKTALCSKSDEKQLMDFIENEYYLPVCEKIYASEAFPLPKKTVISKMGTAKKRVVYTYPEKENTVIKLLTYLMIRRYNGIFTRDLYSFRPQKTAKAAVRRFLKTKDIDRMYSYKVDIHDYFNSIPIDRLLPMLRETTDDDPELYGFLESLLTEKRVVFRGEIIEETKGIMAGTPISAFYANLYLNDLDRYFYERSIPYARYSDDIIVFAGSEDEVRRYAEHIRGYLESAGLSVNPAKESYSKPGEGWIFLGFSVNGDTVDIAPATVKKLKQKMKRKSNGLRRWAARNKVAPVKAASAFIRVFNRKLLESPQDNELSWSYWFFPVINTADSVAAIDSYARQCIRYIITGKHNKSAYRVTYADMKSLGYRNLVHEYYAFKENHNEN